MATTRIEAVLSTMDAVTAYEEDDFLWVDDMLIFDDSMGIVCENPF